ncbi:MAG: phospholipase D-like domain-containing protein [Anaerolineales bacterium]
MTISARGLRWLLLGLIWGGALWFAARQDWRLWTHPVSDAPAPQVLPDVAVWFTDPRRARQTGFQGGPASEGIAAIEAARLSLDLAVYSLDLWPLRSALIAAQQRGVRVRLVTEADNAAEDVAALQQAGIPVRLDTNPDLMHHKFLIVDGAEVWTGSMNFTFQSAYRDNNNLLRLRNPQVVADFQREFDEMFTDGLFGPASRPDTPFPAFTLQAGTGEVYFSPDDGALAHILETVSAAQTQICFLAFSFTSPDLGDLLLTKATAGLQVQGVFDEGQAHSNRTSQYPRLRAAGLNVRLDGNPDLMHHKVIVLDGQTVITGSYNFSRSAEAHNDETLLILHHPDIAAAYQAECERLVAAGR